MKMAPACTPALGPFSLTLRDRGGPLREQARWASTTVNLHATSALLFETRRQPRSLTQREAIENPAGLTGGPSPGPKPRARITFMIHFGYRLVGASCSSRSQSSGLPLPRSKITDMGDGAISSSYGNGPTTVLDHFRMEFGFSFIPRNTRVQQNGSSMATVLTGHR